MSPSSSYSSGELWGFPLMPSNVIVDVLLPNGIFLSVETTRECGLADLKAKVWSQAQEQPLFGHLLDKSSYIFVGVTKDAKCEQFFDEHRRLCDIHLFQPVLRLIEAKGNREEIILNQNITQAIGVSLSEFDKTKNSEAEEFRRSVNAMCRNIVQKRNTINDPLAIILNSYPPRLESSPQLPLHTAENLLSKNTIVIKVWSLQTNSLQTHVSVKVPYDAMPSDIIREVMKKKSMSNIKPQSIANADLPKHYVLKICGVSEYLVGMFPICQFKYIRQCVNRSETPDLMLEKIENVLECLPMHKQQVNYIEPKICKHKSYSLKQTKTIQSSTVAKLFAVQVKSGSYLNVADNLYVLGNIYHGNIPLCSAQKTVELVGSEAPKWKEWLEFNISIFNIPRCAKLCLSVCGVRKKKDEHWPLVWANIPIFDFRGHLLQGKHTIRLWYPPCHMEGFLNPLGISGSNPCKETPCLELDFNTFGSLVKYVSCDPGEYIDAVGMQKMKSSFLEHTEVKFESMSHLIMAISLRDPLSPLAENEKNMLWGMRKFCARIPESLPKLLQSIQWEKQECVQELYGMIRNWTFLEPEIALELLDGKYPDPVIREFAITCLEQGLTDDGLLKYLLQLVTALKFETYLDSSLVRFLLKKAVSNLKIGHYLFWYLKSEMCDGQVLLRFGLILEAYCRACGAYLDQLVRQTEMVEKLVNVHMILQKGDTVSQKLLRENLMKADYQELLKNNSNPLNPACKLGSLCIDLCEVMSSAKRPIILQWNNSDPLAEYFEPRLGILFKNGDDLRQDMLTLQILRVMDDIWQSDGLDLCMSPYICLSMGPNLGMIEIVQNSETIMNIQKKAGVVGSLQLKNGTLHQWLKDANPGDLQYQKAIVNFTKSCAGYCVATLVLGIADRHNDNIMIKKNGQMFHIDFGHFLNHKKKKYGICRNRVPFVLPGDFVRVICQGSTDVSKSEEYKYFDNLCCQAYMSIRRRANVIINLLSMMLGAGIPELSSFEDIEYVRTTLAVEKSRDVALQYFKTCMSAAQNKQWTTKVDWVCHAVRHSGRK